jgi:DNA-binding NtrC family response regulator
LARLLNGSEQAIYALDGQGTILFCNRACLEWLGLEESAVLGHRCGYHSEPEGETGDVVAAGLCPPPTVWEGSETSAVVSAGLRRRRARFIPLSKTPGNTLGLVAIVDRDDLASESSTVDENAAAVDLHERIRCCRQQIAAKYRVDLLLGDSPAGRRIRAQVQVAAASRASVLVFGPPGSGRQHVASTVHYAAGGESSGSLVPLACSVLSPEMIDSTVRALAAHGNAEEGGAKGSLLLNDVDQLTLAVQGSLFSVLGAKWFPLRLMATSRRPLLEMARRGEFRADLASVLSTMAIELPPLVERRQDIPLLAQFFLEEANSRSPKQLAGFTSEALDRLDVYPWPGNHDELARVVAESHARASGPEVNGGDLPQRIHLAVGDATHARRKEEPIALDEFLGRMEQELIQRAMDRAKGNKAKAARLLGMTRPRLYRRLIQLGMATEEGQPAGNEASRPVDEDEQDEGEHGKGERDEGEHGKGERDEGEHGKGERDEGERGA